jgi:hypothetical protein
MAIGFSRESATPLHRSTRSASILEHITKVRVTRRDELCSVIKHGRTDSTCRHATSHSSALVNHDSFASRLLQSGCCGEPGHARSND